MASSILYTIGYEGAEVEDFLATLQVAGVKTIIDIRDVPVSRKPGFSKRSLAKLAGEAGLSYVHLGGLGDPKEGRDAARAGKYDVFRRIFQKHLQTDEARADLADAIRLASDSASCLLCFERDHRRCHRTMVAAEMLKLDRLELRHLGVREGLAGQRRGTSALNGVGAYAIG